MSRLIIRYIKSQRGDTLVEALVAILISSLSLLMLATAVGAASRMVTTSKENLKHNYAFNNHLMDATTSTNAGEVVTSRSSRAVVVGGTDSTGLAITLYSHDGFDGNPIISYEVTP